VGTTRWLALVQRLSYGDRCTEIRLGGREWRQRLQLLGDTDEVFHVGKTIIGVLGQGPIDDLHDVGRQVGPVQSHFRRCVGEDARQKVRSRLAKERQFAGECFEE
jgi:hypothetical protein